VATTFVEGIDFRFVKDNQGFAGSVKGQDKIVFDVSGGKIPQVNEVLTIIYTIDGRVREFQDIMDQSENRVAGIDLLIKEATQVLIDIKVTIVPFPSFTQTETENAVRSSLTTFFGVFKLSQNVNRSDVIAVIEGLNQVDRIEGIPTGTPGQSNLFSLFAKTGQTGIDDIAIADNEFARLGNLTFGVPTS